MFRHYRRDRVVEDIFRIWRGTGKQRTRLEKILRACCLKKQSAEAQN